MDQTSVSRVLTRSLPLLIIAALLGAGVALLIQHRAGTTYKSASVVLITVDPGDPGTVIDDRTTSSEAVIAQGDEISAAISKALPDDDFSYSVSSVAGDNTLTFDVSASSSRGAVDAARVAAQTYVDKRDSSVADEYAHRLTVAKQRMNTAQRELNTIQAAKGTNDSGEVYALQQTLTATSTQVTTLQQAKQDNASVAEVVSTSGSASRQGLSAVIAVAAGAVGGLVIMLVFLLARERFAPRVRTPAALEGVGGPGMPRFDIKAAGGSPARFDLGGLRVFGERVTETGGVITVGGPARPETLAGIAAQVADELSAVSGEGGVEVRAVSDGSLSASELETLVRSGTSGAGRLVLHGNAPQVEQALSQLLSAQDAVIVVCERDRTLVNDAKGRLDALSSGAARVGVAYVHH